MWRGVRNWVWGGWGGREVCTSTYTYYHVHHQHRIKPTHHRDTPSPLHTTHTTHHPHYPPPPSPGLPPSTHPGSTDTSLWTHYNNGARQYCGHTFPDGMKKNERLAANVVTPTTKAVDHDVPISGEEIVGQGLMSEDDWEAV